jgi:hypothetical protein
MSANDRILMPSMRGGHYGTDGQWVQTKHCFVPCGDLRCDCVPPFGRQYSPSHDLRNQTPQNPPSLPATCPWDAWRPERTIS